MSEIKTIISHIHLHAYMWGYLVAFIIGWNLGEISGYDRRPEPIILPIPQRPAPKKRKAPKVRVAA